MEWSSILCAKCLNPQPVFRKCSMCDIKTYYTCVGADCWDINAESPGKTPFWICYRCQPEENKENLAPNGLDDAAEQRKYSTEIFSDEETIPDGKNHKKRKFVKGKRVGKSNYFITEFNTSPKAKSPYQKTCSKCKNVQPVFRGCTVCESKNYFTCVSPDCWEMQPESPGKSIIWICYLCKSNHDGKADRKKVTQLMKKDEEKEESEEFDESEIFDVMIYTEAEIMKNQNENVLKLEDSGSSESFVVFDVAAAEVEQSINEVLMEEGAVGGGASVDLQTVTRDIEEAINDVEDASNFKKLQKFWEGLSNKNNDTGKK